MYGEWRPSTGAARSCCIALSRAPQQERSLRAHVDSGMIDAASEAALQIRDNVERSRFELDVQGHLVLANYRRQGPVLFIDWVEAPRTLRGTGAADRLMQGIVDLARREGLTVRPICGYAAAWLRRHTARDRHA